MKAFLLAAGLGTRLRPLTDDLPKCLLPVGGRPMLDIWLDALARAGIEEALVNTHHHAARVSAHLARRQGPPRTRTAHEPELLGSAGTLAANRAFVAGEPFFLACYADNLTDFDLRLLIRRHERKKTGILATLALFRAEDPGAVGIVELDQEGVVRSFEEKPARAKSDLANAGIYAFDRKVLAFIDKTRPADIGYDLLSKLVGRAQGFVIEGYFRDIGTVESYRAALREWAGRRGT